MEFTSIEDAKRASRKLRAELARDGIARLTPNQALDCVAALANCRSWHVLKARLMPAGGLLRPFADQLLLAAVDDQEVGYGLLRLDQLAIRQIASLAAWCLINGLEEAVQTPTGVSWHLNAPLDPLDAGEGAQPAPDWYRFAPAAARELDPAAAPVYVVDELHANQRSFWLTGLVKHAEEEFTTNWLDLAEILPELAVTAETIATQAATPAGFSAGCYRVTASQDPAGHRCYLIAKGAKPLATSDLAGTCLALRILLAAD